MHECSINIQKLADIDEVQWAQTLVIAYSEALVPIGVVMALIDKNKPPGRPFPRGLFMLIALIILLFLIYNPNFLISKAPS